MIYKRCIRCGKRIPTGTTCGCYQRTYAKPEGIKTEYHSNKWSRLRKYIMDKYDGIDLYTLYRYGRIEPADTVHHIELTSDRPDLFYSQDNLIPVSRQAHVEIHTGYRTDEASVKRELREYVDRYRQGLNSSI